MKLIITEKPSVARDFARCLHAAEKGEGYIKNEEYIITWCVGHLVAMSYPEKYGDEFKSWNLDMLPFLPSKYLYEVPKEVAKQYKVVHKLLNSSSIDTVYWAGDSGREGQTIEELIRRHGGVRKGVTELRVWLDSFTDESIKKGIKDAKPMSEYDNLGNAGVMRGIEDYAFGINFSRALTVKYSSIAHLSTKRPVIAIGRVMTCVLGMIVDRERLIRDFKETSYYLTNIRCKGNEDDFEASWHVTEGSKYFGSPKVYNDNGFLDEKDAKGLISSRTGKVSDVVKKEETKKAPLLFNLAELQSKCSQMFHITPSDTLSIAQSLYEKGLTTYPRTDARVLSTAILCENKSKLSSLRVLYPEIKYLKSTNVGKPYVDDSKITDHYAIIPTGKTNTSGLSSLEEKVFDLICRRYISIFFPAAKIAKASVKIIVDGEEFVAEGKKIADPGYLCIATDIPQTNPTVYKELERLAKGDMVDIKDIITKPSKTKPPKRYTSGSIILAMENAGKLIENEELREQIKTTGIGTSATRADILKKLIDIEYIALNKKTQNLTPTEYGEILYETVKATLPSFLSPEMTASWEKGLSGIENGTISVDEYKKTLNNYITKNIKQIKADDKSESIYKLIIDNPALSINEKPTPGGERVKSAKTTYTCPVCGKSIMHNIYKGKEWYACEDYKKDTGCFFAVGAISGKLIDGPQLNKLITEGKTDPIDFVSKYGKNYKTALSIKIDKDARACKLDFYTEGTASAFKCPKCGERMKVNTDRYFCDCGVSLKKIFGGRNISDDELKILCENKTTGVLTGFYSEKKKKKYDAEIVLDKDYKMSFNFGNNDTPKKKTKKRRRSA